MSNMNYYYLYIFIFLAGLNGNALAKNVNLVDVKINCTNDSAYCKQIRRDSNIFINQFESLKDLKYLIEKFATNANSKSIRYELKEYGEKYYLIFNVEPRYILGKKLYNIDAKTDIETSLFEEESFILVNDFFDESKIRSESSKFLKKLEEIGYLDASIDYMTSIEKGYKKLTYNIKIGDELLVKKFLTNCRSNYLKEDLDFYLKNIRYKKFDKIQFLEDIKDLRAKYNEYGYYFLNIKYQYFFLANNYVDIKLKCENEELIQFKLNFSDQYYDKSRFQKDFKEYLKSINYADINLEIKKYYIKYFEERGYKKVNVDVTKELIEDNSYYGKKYQYNIDITNIENNKIRKINFRGNRFLTDEDINKLLRKNNSDLALMDKFDINFYELFKNKLKNEYIVNGFLSSQIDFGIERKPEGIDIVYDIKEGIQTVVKKVTIKGIEDEYLLNELKEELGIFSGNYFNPIKFETKIKELEYLLKSKGYYLAKLRDEKDENIIDYGPFNREVNINLSFHLDRKYYVENIFVTGISKTKQKIILRKINLQDNQSLTPEFVQKVNSDLASLGLFRKYQVVLLNRHRKNIKDLYINVTENDYGLIELSPGFRTDLGLKLSSKVSLLNLNGENQTVSINASVNQRISQSGLDSSRPSSDANMLEYSTKLNYNYPDFLETYWDSSSFLSFSKKRFYSFDADILKLSTSLSKELTDIFSFSVNYQLERISQFNASKEDDNGRFRIGSITPGIALDFRNNSIRPTAGALFDISCEFANEYLLSQNESDLEFNFYKLVFRNRFYIPLGLHSVLAISASTGMQENLSRKTIVDSYGNTRNKGVIPSIKVFRLSGIDTVRGYAEDEVNYIKSNGSKNDISTLTVDNVAFMTNIKIEPRYFLTDNAVVGFFLDGGNVQVDHYVPFELRTSVGLSFKYYTPVGSFDLAYGHKLNRQKTPDGELESSGRLHFTIGFF